ncbi:phage tail protein I [Clostridium tyrobutyricum]|uniref:phage tail protein I n=1 Tax=Clostridium tyrobutyricum TaxID=1519 RepID=UPI00057D089E|nr:phage tail protein I [Clostridium tyrobutyricum]
MDLNNTDLFALQTTYMKKDITTQALCKVLNPYFVELSQDVKLALIYSRIDELDVQAVDELAWQMHVDFYDYTLSIESKRRLVKSSLEWHKIKGTPEAVEKASSSVFGNSKLQEWFEYGGEPFFFRMDVDITEQGASPENLKKLDILINEYKNKRSWLEIIRIFLTAKGTMYFASTISSGEEITVYPWLSTETVSKGKLNIATANRFVEETTIYPKREV